MIAKTPTQKAIKDCKLPKLTKREQEWGKNCKWLPKLENAKGRLFCAHCGKEINRTDYICPHCGKSHYHSENGYNSYYESTRRGRSERMIAIYTCTKTIKGVRYQVLRSFLVNYEIRIGKPAEHTFYEVADRFVSENGEHFLRTTPRLMMHCDYSMHGTMDLRKYCGENYTLNHYTNDDVCPTTDILPCLKKYYGFGNIEDIRNITDKISPIMIIKSLMTTEGETLYKTNKDLFGDYVSNPKWYDKYGYTIRIAHKHGYHISDIGIFRDYIDQLVKRKMDTHNPALICPENLNNAHQRMTRLIERKTTEQTLLNNMKELLREKNETSRYAERMQIYTGIVWTTGNVTIVPLMTAEDVAKEGAEQHHCVFQLGYWKHAYNLLLTSYTADGEKQETIQIDLRTMTIVQSRGVCNRQTAYHDEIVNYINAHINDFKPRKKARIRKAA